MASGRDLPHGKQVIRRNAAHLDEVKRQVNQVYFGWRAGRDSTVNADIEAMLVRWRSLGDREELVLEWPIGTP